MKYLKISIFSLVLMLLFSTGVYALSLYGSSADKITEGQRFCADAGTDDC